LIFPEKLLLPVAAMRQKIIYQGNSKISLQMLPDYPDPVVVKQPSSAHPSRRVIQSLEREYEMTRALEGVPGVRKTLGQKTIESQPALILEYVEGETLRDTIARKALSLHEKLDIAVDLARILGGIHQQNVIHLDLNSHNILITNDHQAVRLIDLGAASPIDRGGYQRGRPDQVLGTLFYIAPEQTGRINRAVDERSDLYSLGVVLYELMTGRLPFDSTNPAEIIHHHIARAPVSPSEVSPAVPEVVSSIILKLLRKDADNRLLLNGLLREVGFEIREAQNGQEAIELFQQWQPHFIWMDMRMPVMDGYQATAKIRSLPGGDAVKIVALTASAFKEQKEKILDAGCDGLVYKPIRDHEVYAVIGRQLDVEYRYADTTEPRVPGAGPELTGEMLAELPGELLEELRHATLVLDRAAIAALIERIEARAPDTAKGLQRLVDDFQFERIRELLGRGGRGWE